MAWSRATMKPALPWLGLGVWLGLIDGYVSLRLEPDLAGHLVDRAGTLLVSVAVDTTLLLAIVGLLALPARLLSRFLGGSRQRWLAALTVLATLSIVGLIVVEAAEARGALPAPTRRHVRTALALAAVAGIATFAGWPRRHRRNAAAGSRLASGLRPIGLAIVLGLLGVLVGWPGPSPRARDATPNVLLISLDTLRADHVSAYGYDRETTPNLDAFARRGALFTNAFAQSHWTLPSHASMLTGLTPQALGDEVLIGGRADTGGRVSDRFTSIAERLRSRGYRTVAFVGADPYSYIGAVRGFDQGFERYDHIPYPPRGFQGLVARTLGKAHRHFVRHGTGDAAPQVDHALRWLDRHRGEPFFMFLHLFDIHSDWHRLPYESPAPFHDRFDPDYQGGFSGCGPAGRCASKLLRDYATGRIPGPMDPADRRRMIALYDGGIAYTDHQLGRLFDALARLELDRNTVIIVTSDHGEAFFEHGKPLHCDLYDENLRVPLIIVAPGGVGGVRAAENVQLLDIVPTILDLVGLEIDDTVQGRSLGDIVLNGREDGFSRPIFSFSLTAAAVRSAGWKYIRARETARDTTRGTGRSPAHDPAPEELYDLGQDPGEQANLVLAADHAAAAELREQLRAEEVAGLRIRGELLADEEPARITLPQRELDKLRDLGYLE